MGSENFHSQVANLSPAKRALLELRLKKRAEALFTPRIPRRSAAATAPLTFAQQRLWFLNQLEPESPAYNESNAVRLCGSLDRDAFKRALNQIVLRHEVLRTAIVNVEGYPWQVITNNRNVDLPVIDLQAVPTTDRDYEAQRLIAETIRKPFNLSRDLMLRVLLLQLSEQEHIFLVVKHHIAWDGWSSGILWKELTALYEAFNSGEPSTLPQLPIQYADYAVWQREWLQGELLERQLSYWKKQLAGIGALQLPTDRPRPSVRSYQGKRQTLELSKQLSQKLRALSRQQGTTLFMTLLAAFQTLLYRYTGQEDIAVGCPIADRTRQELEGLIGFFVNTLVMRVDFSGNPTFRELLARVREVALGAYGHQDLPFEKLVEELQPERNLTHTPLFQVAFAYQNTPNHALEIPGVHVTPVEKSVETTKFDLHLSANNADERIGATLYYATDLYDDVTIARLLSHLRVLLEGIVAHPDRRLSELPILTEGEKRQLLIEWNDTRRDYPKDKCIHQLFEEQVEKSPDAVAVVFENQQLTYRELNARANRLAHYLQKQGVGAESLVGICVERSLEMVVGLLGILKAGGTYVPLDPSYPKERLRFILEDAQVAVVLTQQRLANDLIEDSHPQSSIPVLSPSAPLRINSVEGLDPQIKVVCLDAEGKFIAEKGAQNPVTSVTPEHLAYVIYTSGSTGTPKGVEIQHRALINLVTWHQHVYNVTPTDRATQLAGPAFDASVWELWPYLTAGASIHILAQDVLAFPSKLLPWLAAEAITICFLPTPLAEAVLEEPWPTGLVLRVLLTGGDKLHRRPHQALPFCLANNYGPTENTVVTTWAPVVTADSDLSPPIGRPIFNTQVYLLDSCLQPVAIGIAAEIYISGDGLARGYLKQPDLTAEKFVPNPFSDQPGARLYKTGDLARYLPDGNIEFLGRIDHQVKIRGFRTELGEIEAVLIEHAGVQQAVVVAREDVPGDKRLVAYVVPNLGFMLTTSELHRFLKSKLPDYMIPYTFISLDRLPITPNGKFDRKAFPAPEQGRPELVESFVAARNPTEEALVKIWAKVLRLERVGVRDNFFELGGHSLLATQVLSRIRHAFAIEIPLRSLFDSPTVEELALQIDVVQARKTAPDEVATLLANLESFSDEEAERLIPRQNA